MAAAGGAKRIVVLGNNNNFFFFGRWKRERGCLWLFFPLSAFNYFFFVFSGSRKKKVKNEKRKKKYERDQERRESGRFDKKKKLNPRSFSLFFYASTWQSRSRVRASPALSRRVIPRLSMVRMVRVRYVVACFFIISFAALFLRTNERQTKREKKSRKKTEERDEESRRDGDH